MKEVLKTFLFAPSARKLSEYDQKFSSVFAGKDLKFDEAMSFIRDFYRTYEVFPSYEIFVRELTQSNEDKLLTYVQTVAEDAAVTVYQKDDAFFSALAYQERNLLEDSLMAAVRNIQADLTTKAARGTSGIIETIDTSLVKLHQLKAQANRNESSTVSLLYGADGSAPGHSLQEIYHRAREKKESDEAVYYDLGFRHFEKAKLKGGDLCFFGGFTSHGKSILLRYAAYLQVVRFGRNTYFGSFEMPHDAVRILFAILHANNKEIFPNTPYIKYEDFKEGQLDPATEDFLFSVADHDLRNNRNYGSLFIEQPNKSKFRMSDLATRLNELENSVMPVHCAAVDYLTLMYPLPSDKGQPDRSDFNQMIKEFKNLLLTHRNSRGDAAPILGFTGAQISRQGMQEAVKREGIYEISAFAEFSEIEKSADHLFTVLMTPEMKATRQLRLQHLKNRDGEVVHDPCNLYVDLERGFCLSEVAERNETEVVEALRTLNL